MAGTLKFHAIRSRSLYCQQKQKRIQSIGKFTFARQETGENMFRYIALSAKGKGRTTNGDRVMADNTVLSTACRAGTTEERFIGVVCDGVGSVIGGADAAELIAKSFEFLEVKDCCPRTISGRFHKLNQAMAIENKGDNAYCMASTVAGIVMLNDRFLSFHLGDTRIYKWHRGNLALITRDHTTEQMIDRSQNTSSTITGYIGGLGYACFPTFRKGDAENGSAFLICSDGVYKSIPYNDIGSILGNTEISVEQKGEAIMKLSLHNGSTDDRSLILIECSA